MGPNHRSFICGGGRGPVQWRYGEDHAANRIPGGSDRLSGGIRPSHPGSPGAGAERGLYTVRFTDTGGGIRVRRDRLYPTRDAAAAGVQRRKAERQPIRPGYWHNVPVWQC